MLCSVSERAAGRSFRAAFRAAFRVAFRVAFRADLRARPLVAVAAPADGGGDEADGDDDGGEDDGHRRAVADLPGVEDGLHEVGRGDLGRVVGAAVGEDVEEVERLEPARDAEEDRDLDRGADDGHPDAPEDGALFRSVQARGLDDLGRDLAQRGEEDRHVEARVDPAGHDADREERCLLVAEPYARPVLETEGAEGAVDEAEVGVVDEGPQHGDDDHGEHDRGEDRDAEPQRSALDRDRDPGEHETQQHLDDEGHEDVDDDVDERLLEDGVAQSLHVVVDAHEDGVAVAVPVGEAVGAGEDERHEHREPEHGERGGDEQIRGERSVCPHGILRSCQCGTETVASVPRGAYLASWSCSWARASSAVVRPPSTSARLR